MSDGRPAANDEERLPWLEPYREPSARRARPAPPAKPRKRASRGGLAALAGIIGLSGALAGGYWLGQRDDSPMAPSAPIAPPMASQASPRQTAASQPATSQPAANQPVPIAAAPVQVAEAPAIATAPPAAKAKRHASKKRHTPRRAKIRNAGVESANIDKVRKEQGEPAPRPWPRLPSPGPAGQVIQLGAFSNPDRAFVTYRARIARYPALGRMPRVIVPVARGSKGRLLYVLRLGTGSRQQSKRVCRNLNRSGDHCLVIG